MALKARFKETEFFVGDHVRVISSIKDGEKAHEQIFDGMVISIKGHINLKTFTVRRIGAQKIGIERIFPLDSPSLKSIMVIKSGVKGVRRAKLYYTRTKSKREIDKIYSRATSKIDEPKKVK